MAAARHYHTATLLADGRVLLVGGLGDDGAVPVVELYDPASGSWTATGRMLKARAYHHRATLLTDGRVLVTGGLTDSLDAEASTELYDPASGTWTATGRMGHGRLLFTATLLPDGRVLVAGGADNGVGGGALATAELYDPATGTWTPTGRMKETRVGHTATLLTDGRVLVTGGFDGLGEGGGPDVLEHVFASAELYDPAKGTWTAAGSMSQRRSKHLATLLADGRVLLVGGGGDLYDPGNGSWTATAPMGEVRHIPTATRLGDGRVLVAGGYSDVILAEAQLFDPRIGSWAATAGMLEGRQYHTATLLTDGRILVAGGGNQDGLLASAELYDPGSGS